MMAQRRTVRKFPVRVANGPLAPLRMQAEAMSDGSYKITGGTGYPELVRYRINPDRAELRLPAQEEGQ